LHDALVGLGFMTKEEGERAGWSGFLATLAVERRAATLQTPSGPALWIAAERLLQWQAGVPALATTPAISVPQAPPDALWDSDRAIVEIMRGRLEGVGPTTEAAVAAASGVAAESIAHALLSLEAEGFAMRGRFTPGFGEEEWCSRRLLARIHSYTLNRLRQ